MTVISDKYLKGRLNSHESHFLCISKCIIPVLVRKYAYTYWLATPVTKINEHTFLYHIFTGSTSAPVNFIQLIYSGCTVVYEQVLSIK